MSNLDFVIVAGLIHNPDYRQVVMPFAKKEFFEDSSVSRLFQFIQEFDDEYHQTPNQDALLVELENAKGMTQETFDGVRDLIPKLFSEKTEDTIKKQNLQWMLDMTEDRFVSRSCELAIITSMDILEGANKNLTRDALPDILREALAVTFDSKTGHDYIDDALSRYDEYHKTENRIKFSLYMLNKITGGGVPKKSLVIPVAPTGVGKSMFLTNEAAFWLTQGLNVLYITLEMSEIRIAERIDAKLMDLTMDELKTITKTVFENKINCMKRNTHGKIIIREYPAGTFHANHLRFVLKDLKSKRGFVPDVVLIDYLGLMASYRMKNAGETYSYLKAVTEEVRGVMLEFNMLGVAPNQTNRDGQAKDEYDLTNMADSHGVSMTGDLIFGFSQNEDLMKMNHMRIMQLKNRFGDLSAPKSFIIGVNKAKMSMYDLDTGMPTYNTQTNHSDLNLPNVGRKQLPTLKV